MNMKWIKFKPEFLLNLTSEGQYFLVLLDAANIYLCQVLCWKIHEKNDCTTLHDYSCIKYVYSNCNNHSLECGSHSIRTDEIQYWMPIPDILTSDGDEL